MKPILNSVELTQLIAKLQRVKSIDYHHMDERAHQMNFLRNQGVIGKKRHSHGLFNIFYTFDTHEILTRLVVQVECARNRLAMSRFLFNNVAPLYTNGKGDILFPPHSLGRVGYLKIGALYFIADTIQIKFMPDDSIELFPTLYERPDVIFSGVNEDALVKAIIKTNQWIDGLFEKADHIDRTKVTTDYLLRYKSESRVRFFSARLRKEYSGELSDKAIDFLFTHPPIHSKFIRALLAYKGGVEGGFSADIERLSGLPFDIVSYCVQETRKGRVTAEQVSEASFSKR